MAPDTLSTTDPQMVHATCPHDCPSVCALEVERLSSTRIGRVHGARDNPYTAGVVCAKVARYAERVHHPDRLSTPLRRVGDKGVGKEAFAPISWDDALDEVANGMAKAAQKWGAESVWPFFYAGTMGFVQRDGINRLRHAMGYSGQHSTLCVTLADTGWKAGTGVKRGVDALEIEDSDLIVVWGGNPVSTQVNLMTHITRARKSRGAKLVVVDPYRTPTAKQADVHLAVKPGTDGALAAAVIHVMLAEGLADRDYMARYTDWDPALEAHFTACTPAWAAEITGLSVAEIVDFARLYGSTKRAYIRVGYGFSRSRNGSVSVHAVTCLPSVSGAWQYRGGGALYGQTEMYRIDRTLIEGLDVVDPAVRILDQSRIGPILTGCKDDLGEGPPVGALLIQNVNPMNVCPETRAVRDGFLRDDLFVCVHEQFMTETAAMADIVLPATTFLEHDDIYIATAHTFLQVSRAVIEPHAQCRSNHEVICALAQRLGAEHPGFHMSALEIIEQSLARSGLPPVSRFDAEHWHDCSLPYETMHYLDGFGHADKRFHFKPDWARFGAAGAGLPVMPGYWDGYDRADEDRPFRLVTAPSRNFLNTSFTETPTSRKKEGKPTLMIHPAAAARLGIEDGTRVRIGNSLGSLVIEAELTDGQQEDVVVVESIWPNAAFEEGMGINTLVSADAGFPDGGAVFHDTAIWVEPA